MPKYPGFVGGSNTKQSVLSDAEETINLYVEQAQAEHAANTAALYPTPGFRQWTALSTVNEVGCRALAFLKNRLFAVFGAGFYEFDQNGAWTRFGPVGLDQNPVQIIFNGVVPNQLGIASAGGIYAFDLGTNTLTGPYLAGGYTHLAYAAGFGLAFQATTGKVNVSAPNDLTSWSAGTFFQRSVFADPWQAMFADANNLVWLLGTETFDVRWDTGSGADQPFEDLSGLVGGFGVAGPFAYASSGAGNFWLARSKDGIGRFVFTQGGIPQPISSYAVNTAVSGYLRSSRIDDAEVLLYEQEGHTFANCTFPAARATLAYDVESPSWAKRGRWDVNTGRYDIWSPRVHAVAFGKHLIGDRMTGTIYEMDPTIATEIDGNGIRRLRRAPALVSEHKRVPIDRFELLLDVGLAVASGQGSDPKVMLRTSRDGGRTWGNERQANVGPIGEYSRRVWWAQFGALEQPVFEVSFTEPIPFRITDAYLNNAEAA